MELLKVDTLEAAREKLKKNHMEEEFPLVDGFNYCKLPQNQTKETFE